MTAEKLLQSFRKSLHEAGDPKRASAMRAYMKDLFPFFGVSAPSRKEIQRKLFPPRSAVSKEFFRRFFCLAWQQEEREMKYVALDFARKYLDRKDRSLVAFFEPFVTDQSWWDTVDSLVPNILGPLLAGRSIDLDFKTGVWIESDNIWLQRSALIVQLTFKDSLDFELLCGLIRRRAGSKEFFVRKAAGWALRQHSKYAPDQVRRFVEQNPQLSGLTRREALRRIL